MTTQKNNSVPHNTEDKSWWLIHGERLEVKFVELCSKRLNLKAQINPAKLTDKLAPDLIVDGVVSDLKTQNTPFFTAGRHGLDPRFTVTFNRKDYERYQSRYPNISIYFWVDWQQTSWENLSIAYLGGIYVVTFAELKKVIDANPIEHEYQRRQNDIRGNAKSSFLLDIRQFKSLFTSDSPPSSIKQ